MQNWYQLWYDQKIALNGRAPVSITASSFSKKLYKYPIVLIFFQTLFRTSLLYSLYIQQKIVILRVTHKGYNV
jgi:hypothetical protein